MVRAAWRQRVALGVRPSPARAQPSAERPRSPQSEKLRACHMARSSVRGTQSSGAHLQATGGAPGRRVRHPAAVGVVNYYCTCFTGSREERTKQNSHKTSKGDKIKLGRLTPARAMYIATLQAVKPDSHPELVKGKRGKNINSNAALSEPKTGIALMCLALEHARNLGMQIAVLDATESSVSFYRDIFGFTCMKPSEPRKYVPMMLHLRSFCPSIPLMARGPNSLVLATQFPSNSEGTSTPKTGRGASTSRGQGGKGSSKSKGRGISRGKNRNS